MIYAQIEAGLVLNTQMIQSSDALDPSFVWVDVTGLMCSDGSPIEPGCSYDGANFIPAGTS